MTLSRLERCKNAWSGYADISGIGDNHPIEQLADVHFGIPPYPTEASINFLSAYSATKDSDSAYANHFRHLAEIQLKYAYDLEQGSGLLQTGKTTYTDSSPQYDRSYVHRDLQSRQIYNYYIAYKVLEDEQYWTKACDCAEEMYRNIPRQPVLDPYGHPQDVVGLGNIDPTIDKYYPRMSAQLFAFNFVKIKERDRPPLPEYYFQMDGNLCAQTGLAFGLLASDPKPLHSTLQSQPLLTKALCQEIAVHEIAASMSVQNQVTGEIMDDTKYPNCFYPDTMYGSLVAFCWVWILQRDLFGSQYGTDFTYLKPQFIEHIQGASRWLAPRMSMKHGRDDCRHRYFSRSVAPAEYSWRLPLYWSTLPVGAADSFVSEIYDNMLLVYNDQDENDGFLAPWAYYAAMGLDYKVLLGL